MSDRVDRWSGKPLPPREVWGSAYEGYPCPHCGSTTVVKDCLRCGAPECCPICCEQSAPYECPCDAEKTADPQCAAAGMCTR